ncbi:MAG: type 1 glutamine amidotransferase domain-containing protein [Actinomycetota bacterium]|nr:type 1 glutamine amidotransferase domain-containing protein [Actinomycetota bacterium]
MSLKGKRIAFLIGPAFQDEEGTEPRKYLVGKGAEVVYIGPQKTVYRGKYGRAKVKVDKTFDRVRPDEFDAVIIPGGSAPEHLRVEKVAVNFVRDFIELGRPLAAICHGPQMLISADSLKGRTITCYEGIRDDVKLAGAKYVDEPVVVDGNLITSRKPSDIPMFNEAIYEALKSKD